jgi:hypothetical protein
MTITTPQIKSLPGQVITGNPKQNPSKLSGCSPRPRWQLPCPAEVVLSALLWLAGDSGASEGG